jgi:hypothetical protein
MFAAEEMLLDLSFRSAQARLADLAGGGLLTHLSERAYFDGLSALTRVGLPGAALGLSRLADVHFLDMMTRGESAVLALRWEVTGLGGRLVPALDADIALTPAGEHSTQLSLAAAYRPPLGAGGTGLDRAILHGVAEATIRSLVTRLADALGRRSDEALAHVQGNGHDTADPAFDVP